MTAANKEEDNEPISEEELDNLIFGNEPDESNSGGELDEPISGDELDEQISADELDEPISLEEADNQIFGDEPDESNSGGDLDEPISQEELDKLVAGDEPDEQISGDELDELIPGDEPDEQISGDELDEPISGDEPESAIEHEEISKKKDAEDRKKTYKGTKKLIIFVAEKYKRKRKLFIAAATGLCLLTGAGYFSLQNKKEKAPEVIKLPVMDGRSLVFGSFVIPFRDHDKFAYLSLDISFRLMNRELAEEMTEKRDLLRGIIYDLLREEVNKPGKLPPLDKLKEYIIKGVNNALSTGKVKEAYVIDFLAV